MVDGRSLGVLLMALDEQLARGSETYHLVVIGGSGLLGIGAIDRPTDDVDVVAFIRDGELVSAEPIPPVLREAVRRVAADFGLSDAWLNAGPTSLLVEGSGLPDGFLERCEAVEVGPALRASYASRFDQIHLKLMALADRGYPRDESDLRQLDPSPDELHRAAAWCREHFVPGPYDEMVANALARFGVEDAGRDA